jgi:hypothetical protein
LRLSTVEISPFHSSALKKANEKRKVVKSPEQSIADFDKLTTDKRKNFRPSRDGPATCDKHPE